jgi:hypothetical protein
MAAHWQAAYDCASGSSVMPRNSQQLGIGKSILIGVTLTLNQSKIDTHLVLELS